MKLTGILLIGFIGFMDQLLTQISTRFSWFEKENNATKNVKQLISLAFGEILAISILVFSPEKLQVLEMFGANVGIYIDAVLSGILYAAGGNLAHMIMDWINANKDIAESKAEEIKKSL